VGYEHNDPSLKTGVGGLTVWKLREMARRKQFDELNDMFNNGLNMNALPVGLAAGAAHPMLEAGIQFVSLLLNYLTVDRTYLKVDTEQFFADSVDSLVSRSWRGKVFFPSNNRKISRGRNRMQEFFDLPTSRHRTYEPIRYDASRQPSSGERGNFESRDLELRGPSNPAVSAGSADH